MRSNFIKELESCTVTLQGPFRKRPNGILTVCHCKLARVCVQEGMNEPTSSPGETAVGFSGVIFHHHECSMPIELAKSAPSGWQRSGGLSRTSLSAARRKAWRNHRKRQSQPDLRLHRKSEQSRTFSSSQLAVWATAHHRSTREGEAVSRLTAFSTMRFENFP